jgi:hypothetical protein
MKYAYEDLGDEQFETLVLFMCQKLLGIAVQGFSKGPDGGRDAKFVGTAERHPSTAAPWVGTTIIQAKHTNGYNRLFSESDFYSETADKTVLSEEVVRLRKLRNASQLDHYMLFANRRLGGNAESDIRAYISHECGIPDSSIYLCGVEQIEMLLRTFPDVPVLAKLDPIDSPLIVSPDDLAEVVDALARHQSAAQQIVAHPPTERTTYDRKNTLNNMTADYAEMKQKLYLKETAQIRTFLAHPDNQKVRTQYESVVEEFQAKIVAYRKDYQTFDRLMEYLLDLLFGRDALLRGNKRLTRVMLFYMYWNCDIGKVEDAPPK